MFGYLQVLQCLQCFMIYTVYRLTDKHLKTEC